MDIQADAPLPDDVVGAGHHAHHHHPYPHSHSHPQPHSPSDTSAPSLSPATINFAPSDPSSTPVAVHAPALPPHPPPPALPHPHSHPQLDSRPHAHAPPPFGAVGPAIPTAEPLPLLPQAIGGQDDGLADPNSGIAMGSVFGDAATTPQRRPLNMDTAATEADVGVGGRAGAGTGEHFGGMKLLPEPLNLAQWRERLFNVDDTIVMTEEEFQTYFPYVDNVYSHRSTQRYKRKPFICHYWDCRLKGRPPGTPKSRDPNKKKRRRVARERDLCDVKIKITEYQPGAMATAAAAASGAGAGLSGAGGMMAGMTSTGAASTPASTPATLPTGVPPPAMTNNDTIAGSAAPAAMTMGVPPVPPVPPSSSSGHLSSINLHNLHHIHHLSNLNSLNIDNLPVGLDPLIADPDASSLPLPDPPDFIPPAYHSPAHVHAKPPPTQHAPSPQPQQQQPQSQSQPQPSHPLQPPLHQQPQVFGILTPTAALPPTHPALFGGRYFTIQRVNGSGANNRSHSSTNASISGGTSGGSSRNGPASTNGITSSTGLGPGSGSGFGGGHRHTLADSDRVKKNSVQRSLLKEERDRKKSESHSQLQVHTQQAHPPFQPHRQPQQRQRQYQQQQQQRQNHHRIMQQQQQQQQSKGYHTQATGAAAVTVQQHAAENSLKLFGSCFCPFVHRVWIALELKGIPYQYIEVDPYSKPEALLQVNPRGLVPALRHGDWGCYESTVLLDYLEDLDHTHPLLPQGDPKLRAHCRLWADHVNRHIIPAFYRVLQSQEPAAQAAEAAALSNKLTKLVNASHANGPFFLGPRPSWVDVQLAPWLLRLSRVLTPYRGWPAPERGSRWAAWIDAVEAEPAVQATTSDDNLYLDSYQRYAENRPNTSMLANAINSGRSLP